MKKKISKIWGIGLTFVLAMSLLLVAAPGTVSAAEPVINEWDEFAYPDEGEDGDWFWDPDIGSIYPLAEAINGDLYAGVFIPTTAAVDAVAEVSTITLSGSPRAGDVVTVTIDGNAVTYTVLTTDTLSLTAIAASVAAAINADATVSAIVTATASGSVVTLTADVAGLAGAFTLACAVTGITAGSLSTTVTDDAVSAAAATAQVDSIAPTVANNTTYILRITISAVNYDFVYTSSAAASVTEIVNAFVSLINTNATVAAWLTASNDGAAPDNLVLTAANTGLAGGFTSTNIGTGTLTVTPTAATDVVAEQSLIAVGGSPQLNDVITATVDGNGVTYTVVEADIGATDDISQANVATSLAAAIDADATVGALVNCTVADDDITLTENSPDGSGFTLTCTVTAVTDSTMAVVCAETVAAADAVGAVGDDNLFKSTDGARSWEETEYADDLTGEGAIVAIVCSGIDEDTLYVTDGNYVYKTDDGGDEWDYVAKDGLETALQGTCGTDIVNEPITSIDVGYQDEDPFVFIGVRSVTGVSSPGSVYYIEEETYGAEWTDMDLECEYSGYDALSVGCAPDFEDSDETYVVISDGSETYVVYTDGGICEWTEFAELLWDCETANHFGSAYASRIGFPDDWEDTETLFVGVVDVDYCDDGDGGDVYSVSDGEALDRNVVPGEGGCDGDATDIISLDVCGDTDDASVIAGSLCDTTVYYSSDGGWEWDPSIKDPTGEYVTYVLWYGDCGESALAATTGCECAVSLTCVSEEEDAEDVGMSWNQISLIATDVDCVLDLDHSPGYITDSETMFMVTESNPSGSSCDTTSLFRYDGTDWERVFCSTTYYDDFQGDEDIAAVQVSPDFLDTETVFVLNDDMDIFRSQDAGCSWDRLAYPCDITDLTSWAVLDEDTIYVGADGVVLLTERHGGRPWDECEVEDADDGTEAGWIRYFAFDGDSIMVGDNDGQVFLCEVDPDEDWEDQEWHLVGDCNDIIDDDDTSVAFDPGYAVTDDEGENMIYAAAGNVIARCIIDPDEAWEDQEWVELVDDDDAEFWGMKVVSDTVLYVGDLDDIDTNDGGVLRSLNPTEEDEDDVVFERLTYDLDGEELNLRQLTAGENGCPDSNVLWTIDEDECDEIWFWEDTLATPVIPVSPADGTEIGETGEVTLTWEALCDAVCYEVELYRYCEECPDDKEYVDLYCDDDCDCDTDVVDNCIECEEDCVGCSDETCCLYVTGGWVEVEDDLWEIWSELEPGSTYYWRIRVCDPVLSKWSELWEFTTEMTAVDWWGLCSPECGGDDIIITPNFSWEDVSDATSYEVQLATNEDFDPVIASGTPTTNAWLGAPELDYGTTYYWRVRALKDGVTSDWVTCIFTTMAEPAAEQFCCPECGLCFDTEAELEAHWNAVHAPVAPSTPAYIWVIIAVGALLVIAVLILIVRTRRTV